MAASAPSKTITSAEYENDKQQKKEAQAKGLKYDSAFAKGAGPWWAAGELTA